MDLALRLTQLAEAANMLPTGFLLVDSAGTVALANDKAAESLGYAAGELVGLSVDQLVPSSVLPRHADLRAEFWAAPSERRLGAGRNLTALRKDGTEFAVEVGLKPLELEGEAFVTVQLTDVSVITSARQDLVSLMDSIDGIIFEGDAQTFQLNYVSQRAEQLLGYPVHEWTSDPHFWVNHIHEEDRERAASYCQTETRAGRDHVLEYRMVAADGRARWFRDFVRINLRDGKPYKLRGVMVDITDVKRAEEESARLGEQVQAAQKMASLAVLAGGIAHDFNNLLVGVLGNAELILDDLPPESPIRDRVRGIQTAARRAADLTHQMLAYSGKGKFRSESLDLNRLIVEMSYLLEAAISKTAVIKYDLPADLPPLLADPTQIRQVIMNLLTNASDAIEGKSGIITVCTGLVEADSNYLAGMYLDEETRPGRYLTLEVSDTGRGMDEQTRAKMFDPFFTTKFAGRGLGLAATLGIVRGHEGTLKVYSEPGRGTSIKILWPTTDQPLSQVDGKLSALQVPRREGAVLVIDDDETVCSVLKKTLERMGFEVIAAGDGRQGLEAFKQHSDGFKVVFLDLTMPHMDGEETFREIRILNPECRVVLMSGYNQQEATSHFVGKGLAGFLQKPFHISAVAEVLRETLDA